MKLRVLTSDGRTSREIPLNERRITIGSATDNTVVLSDSTVSRYHATLHLDRHSCSVSDLRSTNGTFVKGARIGGSVTLKLGDEVRFGAVRCQLQNNANDRRQTASRLMIACAGFFAVSFIAVFFLEKFIERGPMAKSEAVPAASSTAASVRPMAVIVKSPATGISTVAASTSTPLASEEPDANDWLVPLNAYRSAVGVPPVTANAKFSLGDFLHSRYIVKNYRGEIAHGVNLGPTMHTEDSSKPWYTSEGLEAAKAGDVDEMWDPGGIAKPSWAIDDWMLGPFHRLSLLDPHLHSVGYGYFCANSVCVAALNVHGDTTAMQAMTATQPIKYPPDGGVIEGAQFAGEWPDPLTSCPGYRTPAGFPITLQLGAVMAPSLSSYELTLKSATPTKIPVCGFDSHTYANPDAAVQQLGRQILLDFGAVVIIPRAPLVPGKYQIALTSGDQNYSWSFSVK